MAYEYPGKRNAEDNKVKSCLNMVRIFHMAAVLLGILVEKISHMRRIGRAAAGICVKSTTGQAEGFRAALAGTENNRAGKTTEINPGDIRQCLRDWKYREVKRIFRKKGRHRIRDCPDNSISSGESPDL